MPRAVRRCYAVPSLNLRIAFSLFIRVESILPKFAAGTPQHTLAIRRLRAFEIAQVLIRREQSV